MHSRRSPHRETVFTAIAISIVLGFFTSDILESAGWDWREWAAAVVGEETNSNVEIRNYVEFVSIPVGSRHIVTGIEFDSSYQRRIVKQWCYIERSSDTPGAAEVKLSLASKNAADVTEANLFVPENLRPLGLTEAEAKGFIAEHCRFR